MKRYVAIVEDEGPSAAVGVWFPDLPGCFSAGDSLDESLANAVEAVVLYTEEIAREGGRVPEPRSLAVPKHDPAFHEELEGHMAALISVPALRASAA